MVCPLCFQYIHSTSIGYRTYEESVDDSDEGMETGYHSQGMNSVGSMGTNNADEGHHVAPLDPNNGPEAKDSKNPMDEKNWDPDDGKSKLGPGDDRLECVLSIALSII